MIARCRASGGLVACLFALSSCGVNLLVQHQDAELRLADGTTVPVALQFQVPTGFLYQDDMPFHNVVFGLLCEPLDWICSTGIAIRSLGSRDDSVAGGPLGWLAALTPFATLIPTLHLPPASFANVDATQLALLQAQDPEVRAAAARAAFYDATIQRCDPR